MPLSRPTCLRRSLASAATGIPRVRLSSAAAAVFLGSLAFAGLAEAAGDATAHANAASRSLSASQLPSWYHTPLNTAALSHEVAVPKDPETVTGKVRLTQADYRNGSGKLAVDASQAIGQTLIAGESLQLPGNALFSLNSHLPVAGAQQEITQLNPSLANVTGVTCEGYTDYGPHSAARDITLGKQRALRVCALIHAENPQIAIKTVSYGSTLPAIVGGTTHPPRSLNRRVIVDITTSTTPPAPTPTPPPSPTPTPTTVPGPPILNSATPGDSQATVTFAAPTSGGQPTSYEVSTDAGASWTPVTTSGASPYSITLTGLTNGTTYTVEVRAVDSAGDSGPSNSLPVTPAAGANAPGGPTITDSSSPFIGSGNYTVTLDWTAGNDGGSAITGWQYSQASEPYAALSGVTESAGTYSATFDTGINSCTHQDDSVPYTIEAINNVGTSVASNVETVTLNGCT
jgi:outer membrane protein OmpA-like peptidoglycan-associated protein